MEMCRYIYMYISKQMDMHNALKMMKRRLREAILRA